MSKKKYRVTGDSEVAGCKKGETFSYDYTDEQERALLGVHIEVVKESKRSSSTKKDEGGEK